MCRDRGEGARSATHTTRRRGSANRPAGRSCSVPGAVPADPGRESVPMRAVRETRTASAHPRRVAVTWGNCLARCWTESTYRVRMQAVATGALIDEVGESTSDVRARVAAARDTAAQRWSEYGWRTNAEVPGPALRQKFRLSRAALAPVERALRKGVITARGADRALRVAWSVADLAGEAMPGPDQVVTALDFRDRGFQ